MTLEVRAELPSRRAAFEVSAGAGQVTAVVGPNGSGKSTLLRLVAGLLVPSPGTVRLDGRLLTESDSRGRGTVVPPHRRGTVLLPQRSALLPHRTVLENTAFGPRAHGASRAQAASRARDALARVGAEDLTHRRAATLSGGQAARVSLARTLAAEPEVLLLDEPFAAADVRAAAELRNVLRSATTGMTVLLVTHDLLDVTAVADAVVVLEEGGVAQAGTVADVLALPRTEFAARFAGWNRVTGTLTRDGLLTADGSTVPALPPAGGVTLGSAVVALVRPSSVRVIEARAGTPSAVVTGMETSVDRVLVHVGALTASLALDDPVVAALRIGGTVGVVIPPAQVRVLAT